MADENNSIPTLGPWNSAVGKDPNLWAQQTWVRMEEEMFCRSSVTIILENTWWKTDPSEACNIHFYSADVGLGLHPLPPLPDGWLHIAAAVGESFLGRKLSFG